jgi:hypothetical protein
VFGFIDEQQAVVQAVVADFAGTPWEKIHVRYSQLATAAAIDCDGYTAARELIDVFPWSWGRKYYELRAAMADENGAWFTSTLDLTRGQDYVFSFEYQEKPAWNTELADDICIADLKMFPRPWDKIPDWHPVRRLYTQESWRAELSKGAAT